VGFKLKKVPSNQVERAPVRGIKPGSFPKDERGDGKGGERNGNDFVGAAKRN